MACSMEYRNEVQKNPSQTSCSSAPLPNSSLTSLQAFNPTPLRPRSLYTTHSYHPQTDEATFQVINFNLKNFK